MTIKTRQKGRNGRLGYRKDGAKIEYSIRTSREARVAYFLINKALGKGAATKVIEQALNKKRMELKWTS